MNDSIKWLAVLRGCNILLVVMVHVQLINMATGENHDFCNSITMPFNPIRMPLFVFCSGALLYVSRIKKGWKTIALYKDKIQRIAVPFIFFCIVYYFIKILFSSFVKTAISFSLSDFLKSFVSYSNSPSAHLWYLATLFTLMLMYPLFNFMCKKSVYTIIFTIFSVIIYFIDLSFLADYNYFNIQYINKYIVFFFFGIVFMRYELWNYLNGYWKIILLFVSYVVLISYGSVFFQSIIGILLAISIFLKVAQYKPNLFKSYRNYIYQIYMMSLIFQPFVELILWKKLFYNEHLFLLFYVINVAFGIYGPVFVSKLIEKVPVRMIRMCFGLK